jgi:hypothetical protein
MIANSLLAISGSIACALAGLLGMVALLQLSSVRLVKHLYGEWSATPSSSRVGGVMEMVAAVLLFVPNTRIWGIFLAAFLFFTAGVSLLKNRRYAIAAIDVLLMIALVPASVSALSLF